MKLVNRINYKFIISVILIIFGFFITLSILSHTFDGDLGWHLQFGQNAWNNSFQYQDSYTWGSFGNDWINHEWGGDLIFWYLYNNFGYFALNIFIAIFLWAGFLGINLIFTNNQQHPSVSRQRTIRLSPSLIIISLLSLIAVKFITITRLAMLGPFFLVWLLWTLEKIPSKKTYYYWPIILYLWSFFHGSWILGFIVINIYLLGKIIELISHKAITINNLKKLSPFVIWQLVSAVFITLNPYGYKIWIEIFKYFNNNFYKSYITEWLSSYTYPVFWWPLIIVSFCSVIVYLGWKNRKITYAQLLLFVMFFISGLMYKRNNLFMVLVCIPILQFAWIYFKNNLNIKLKNKLIYTMGITTIFLIILILKPTLHYTNNIWQDDKLMTMFGFPYKAVEFLKSENTIANDNNTSLSPAKRKIKIFNTYSWGGYLIWTLPNYLYFADGRSAATWKNDNNELILKEHLNYLTKKDKLKKLENKGIKYIILQQHRNPYHQPVKNKLDLKLSQIYIDLESNNNWKKIYQDEISIIWSRILYKSL